MILQHIMQPSIARTMNNWTIAQDTDISPPQSATKTVLIKSATIMTNCVENNPWKICKKILNSIKNNDICLRGSFVAAHCTWNLLVQRNNAQNKTPWRNRTLSTQNYPTSIGAVAADEKLLVEVQRNALSWYALVGIFNKVRVISLQGIHTRHRHILLLVRQVLNVAKCRRHLWQCQRCKFILFTVFPLQ